MTRTAMTPPAGYESWLDYAVETFDTRAVSLDTLFEDGLGPDREAVRQAARDELRRLRAAVAAGNGTSER